MPSLFYNQYGCAMSHLKRKFPDVYAHLPLLFQYFPYNLEGDRGLLKFLEIIINSFLE